MGGYSRHLDPIIDNPLLTHQQRVCRLYRWALKELKSYLTSNNAAKFNIGYKVVRGRFEKYRYVTDPAMCDLMVRETQKYMRDMCNPHFMRVNPTSPQMNCYHIHPMHHPDHAYCYDHWTQPEVHWYDDAKMHRYRSHHPLNGEQEFSNRFGDGHEASPFFLFFIKASYIGLFMWMVAYQTTFLNRWHGIDDPDYIRFQEQFDMNFRQVIEYEERTRRSRYSNSTMEYNWDQVIGAELSQKFGLGHRMGRYTDKPQWLKDVQKETESHKQ
jgi:hypothetical protein